MLLPVYFLLLCLSAIDIRSHRIPNKFLLVLLIYSICFLYLENQLVNGFVRATLVAVVLLASDFFTRSAIGMGDVKLLVLLAFFLPSTQMISVSFFAMIFLSGGFAVICILSGRGLHVHIPFAPFITLAFIIGTIFPGVNK